MRSKTRFLILLLSSSLLQCKTRNTPSENKTDSASAPAYVENKTPSKELPALLLGSEESIIAISPSEADQASAQLGLSLADTENGPISKDETILVAGGVLGGIGATVAAVATFKFVKGNATHEGGTLGYLTSLAPELYYKMRSSGNLAKIRKGKMSAYNKVSGNIDDAGKPFEYTQEKFGGDIQWGAAADSKTFTYTPHGGVDTKELDSMNMYLGVLPSENIVKLSEAKFGEIKKNLKVVSIVQGHEYKDVAGTLKEGSAQIDSPDNAPVPINLIFQGVDFIDSGFRAGSNVYVHCKSGKGRSATLVAAWYIKHYGMSAKEAAAFVKERRSVVSVTGGSHQKALQEFEIAWNLSKKPPASSDEINKLYSDYGIKTGDSRWKKIQAGISARQTDPFSTGSK